jgi:hypothetical protein
MASDLPGELFAPEDLVRSLATLVFLLACSPWCGLGIDACRDRRSTPTV